MPIGIEEHVCIEHLGRTQGDAVTVLKSFLTTGKRRWLDQRCAVAVKLANQQVSGPAFQCHDSGGTVAGNHPVSLHRILGADRDRTVAGRYGGDRQARLAFTCTVVFGQ